MRSRGRARAAGKRIAELLSRPCSGWVLRHRDVHNPPPLVCEDDEHEQQAVRDGRHHEEVGCCHLRELAGQERPPGLRRRSSSTAHVLRDRGLAQDDSEFPELAMDSRRTPQRKMLNSTFSALSETASRWLAAILVLPQFTVGDLSLSYSDKSTCSLSVANQNW